MSLPKNYTQSLSLDAETRDLYSKLYPKKIGHFIKPQVVAKEEEEDTYWDDFADELVDVPEGILENWHRGNDLFFDPRTAKVYDEEFVEVGFFQVFKDGKFENVMTAYEGETFALQLAHDRDSSKRFRIKFNSKKNRELYSNI